MASTINADNGVVSGSSGVKTTADTSGVLALQSNGSTALSISTGLVTTLTNPLPIGSGGTNSTATPTAGGVAYGTGTANAYTGAGLSGQVLTSAGSSAPTWATVSSGNFGTDVSFTDYTLTTSSALNSAVSEPVFMQAVSIDGVSELMIFTGSASAHVVVWNSSTNTFGTPVLLRTATGLNATYLIGAVAISATSVLVCSLPYSTTALETVVLTISGNTVTVNTPVATTLSAVSGLVFTGPRLVAVGSSYVLTYSNTTGQTPKFRAITVSGTTPTVGAELAYAGGDSLFYTHSYAHSSSVLLSFSASATVLYVNPISVSGTTLTNGTAATLTTNSNVFSTGLLSTGRYAVVYRNTTARGAVITITGTTATASAPATTTAVASWYPMMQVFSNQAIFLTGDSVSDRLNVITDTSGTATVGTSIAAPFTGHMVGYLASGKVLLSPTAQGNTAYAQFGISSGSPVQEKLFQTTSSSSTITTYNFENAYYAPPLAGLPNSGNFGILPILSTAAGKTAPPISDTRPFSITIDGTSPAKLQQAYCPYNRVFSDAISTAICWATVNSFSATSTTVQVRKMTLV